MDKRTRFDGLDIAQKMGLVADVFYDNDQPLVAVRPLSTDPESSVSSSWNLDVALQEAARPFDPRPVVPKVCLDRTSLDNWVKNYEMHHTMLRFSRIAGVSVAAAYHVGDMLKGNRPLLSAQGNNFLESYEALQTVLTDEFTEQYVAERFREISS